MHGMLCRRVTAAVRSAGGGGGKGAASLNRRSHDCSSSRVDRRIQFGSVKGVGSRKMLLDDMDRVLCNRGACPVNDAASAGR